jgi:hypothetical protein
VVGRIPFFNHYIPLLPYQMLRGPHEQSYTCNQDESATVFPLALPHLREEREQYSTKGQFHTGEHQSLPSIVSLLQLTFSSFSSIICGATVSSASTITVLALTSVSILLTPTNSVDLKLVDALFKAERAFSLKWQSYPIQTRTTILNDLPSIFPSIRLTAPAHPSLFNRNNKNTDLVE